MWFSPLYFWLLLFQSTPSVWRETLLITAGSQSLVISIHSLRVEGDSVIPPDKRPCGISIHSLRVEGDFIPSAKKSAARHFNPLPPCGGRHSHFGLDCPQHRISIHSLRVEGDRICGADQQRKRPISIHSLRVEGDIGQMTLWLQKSISIHSLRVEGDDKKQPIQKTRLTFQSTPSVWRETRGTPGFSSSAKDFNPLPPCGGRQQNCTAFRLKLSRANAILTKKNTDTLLHVRKNTFFLIFLRKSGCESLLLFLCA